MIPLTEPNLIGNELKYVKQWMETGWISSARNFVNQFEKRISDNTKSNHSVASVNGKAALHTALNILFKKE